MSTGTQPHELRAAAEQLIARLRLSGYEDESILAVDAWMDTPEFQREWAEQRSATAYSTGAYLGQAIVERLGGVWNVASDGLPRVRIDRNGTHFVGPFSKVHKRVLNGTEDHLLGLLKLAEELSGSPAEAPSDSERALEQAWRYAGDGPSPLGCLAAFFFGVVLLPMIVLIVVSRFVNGAVPLIGAAVALLVGLCVFGLAVYRYLRVPPESTHPKGSLRWEAELALTPLEKQLRKAMGEPNPDAAKIAFYTAQITEVVAIITDSVDAPGRGYRGFDEYGSTESSWAGARERTQR